MRFLGENDFDKATRKTGPTLFFSLLLIAAEWYIVVPLAFGLVVLLRSEGIGFLGIYFVLSCLNAALSFLIIFANDLIQLDVTLMEGVERVLSYEKQERLKSWKLSGSIALALVFFWSLFYQGPAYAYLLLRRKETIRKNKPLFIIGTSFIQMLPWTFIYISGYEGFLKIM